MSHPRSQAEYLARIVPASVAGTQFGRRGMFKAAALGAGAAVGLSACGGGSGSGGGSSSGPKTITFGSNASDKTPKEVLAAEIAAYQTKSGNKVNINTVDHNTFQENINTYLQGRPDDVFTWFSGYRMRYFASKGLAGDLSDVWAKLDGYSDAFKAAATGDDGKQYLVPFNYYPWAVFYRKSVFDAHGYTVPKTLDELKSLGAQMQKDGLIPIAFADKDGWPAMGTFDILDMRINGYQFHVDLMAHKESWSDPKVKQVFSTWAELLPFHQADPLGRTWQEAAQTLQQKKAGMYLLGLFVAQQFSADEQSDLDFFTFPEIDSSIGADSLDAPIDGYMMSKRPSEEAAAKDLLTYLGGADAQAIIVKKDPGSLVPNSNVDTSGYTALQKKAAELVGSAKHLAQFLDRDADPAFASTVMIPSLQTFLQNPKDIDGLCNSIEAQAKSIYTT